jgi:hypothetical protein
MVEDGNGGVFVSWENYDTISGSEIYIQHVDKDGIRDFGKDGMPVVTVSSLKTRPKLIYDNNGSAIVTWEDKRDGEWKIYAQKINIQGERLWGDEGILLSNYEGTRPEIVSSGSGAIIVWEDLRSDAGPNGTQIYAQRVYGTDLKEHKLLQKQDRKYLVI